jgi:histidine triad (HIT) family protein
VPEKSNVAAKTIFKRIIDREIPANIVYEDDRVLAFHDVNPQAPVHVLVIPKQEIASLAEAQAEDGPLLGHLLLTVKKLAHDLGLQNGFRTVMNTGPDGGQTVNHLHIHILGQRPLHWPPG